LINIVNIKHQHHIVHDLKELEVAVRFSEYM